MNCPSDHCLACGTIYFTLSSTMVNTHEKSAKKTRKLLVLCLLLHFKTQSESRSRSLCQTQLHHIHPRTHHILQKLYMYLVLCPFNTILQSQTPPLACSDADTLAVSIMMKTIKIITPLEVLLRGASG